MKLKSFLCLLLFVCTVVSCYEPDDGDYIAPITLYESIGGRWSLSGITMTDELAVATNISRSKQNLGVYFNYQDFVLDLNVNGDNRPNDYKVHGDVPPLFPASGYWRLNSDFQLTNSEGVSVLLYQDAEKTQKTAELKVVSVPGSNGEMELQLVRSSGGKPFISYNFKFKSLQ